LFVWNDSRFQIERGPEDSYPRATHERDALPSRHPCCSERNITPECWEPDPATKRSTRYASLERR
jgi:hypothetical protein